MSYEVNNYEEELTPVNPKAKHKSSTVTPLSFDSLLDIFADVFDFSADNFDAPNNNTYLPEIRQVIFSYPATIVFWSDGTKTVVKCGDGDTYDEEKGLAMAICKKVINKRSKYNDYFKKWISEADRR